MTTEYLLCLTAGLVLQTGLRRANVERLLIPKKYTEPTWALSLFAVAWANAATATTLVFLLTATAPLETETWWTIGKSTGTGIALAAWSWGGWMAIRHLAADISNGLKKGWSAEEMVAKQAELHLYYTTHPEIKALYKAANDLIHRLSTIAAMGGAITAVAMVAMTQWAEQQAVGMNSLGTVLLFIGASPSIAVALQCEHLTRTDDPESKNRKEG